MPRFVTTHHVNECNRAIKLLAGDPGPMGAPPWYEIVVPDGEAKWGDTTHNLEFHTGPVADGVNGITHEILLAVLIDRLEGFQAGPFACPENAAALTNLKAARDCLGARTQRRLDCGVEGTHAPERPE